MAINNAQELTTATTQASRLVQEIQDYCGRTLRDESKINFPRGLIGTAASYRGRCPGYLSADQVSSCAYGFMYLDVLWWLLSTNRPSERGEANGDQICNRHSRYNSRSVSVGFRVFRAIRFCQKIAELA